MMFDYKVGGGQEPGKKYIIITITIQLHDNWMLLTKFCHDPPLCPNFKNENPPLIFFKNYVENKAGRIVPDTLFFERA